MTPISQTRWGIVWLAILTGVMGAMQIGKAPAALLDIRLDLSLDLVTTGLVASMFSALSAILGVTAGILADRNGHRRFIVAGLSCLAVGSFAGAISPSGGALLAARFFEGLGFVAVVVSVPSIIIQASAQRDLRLTLGLWGTYMPAGMATMVLLSPVLLATLGWRGLWAINGVLVCLFAIVFLARTPGVGSPPPPDAGRGTKLADVKRILKRPGTWLLATCFTTYSAQWIAMMTWLPTLLIERQHMAPGYAGALTALVIFVNVPGNITGAWLLHRGVPRWLLMAGASGAIGLLGAGVFSGSASDGTKFALALAFSYIGGMLPSAALAGSPIHAPAPHLVGTTNGMIVQGASSGVFLGPPVMAALVGGLGSWQAAGWAMPVAGFAGVLLALGVRIVERRMKAEKATAGRG